MNYNNQFVQTGAQSDIGANLTTNIKDSYRMGAELEAGWSPLSWLTVEGNAALSRNIIKDFDEMASVDWESTFRKIHYNHSTLAFSPSAILNGMLNLHYKGFEAVWHTNFVSRQYLNNIFNRHYAASGWVYSSILDNNGHPNENRYTQIGFIPMAGFNMMGSVAVKF